MKVVVRIFSADPMLIKQVISFHETNQSYVSVGEYYYKQNLFCTQKIDGKKKFQSVDLSADIDCFTQADLETMTKDLSISTKGFVIGEMVLPNRIFAHYDNGSKKDAFAALAIKTDARIAKSNQVLGASLRADCDC